MVGKNQDEAEGENEGESREIEQYTFKTEDGKEVTVKPHLTKDKDGVDRMWIEVNGCQVTGDIDVPNLNIEKRKTRGGE